MLSKSNRISEENEMSTPRHTKQTMSRSEKCTKCNGTGYVKNSVIFCPKCNQKGEPDRVFPSEYKCMNPNCSIIEFVDDFMGLKITLDQKAWEDEP